MCDEEIKGSKVVGKKQKSAFIDILLAQLLYARQFSSQYNARIAIF